MDIDGYNGSEPMHPPDEPSTPQKQISPVLRTRQQARLAYDRMSRMYDWMAWRWERRTIDLGLRLLAALPGERILEIGCGTGHSLATLTRTVAQDGSVYGLDLSPGMLARARQTLTGSEQFLLTCGDGLTLPFAKDRFDAIFMSSTLELFDTPEIPQVLAECRRVLQPTGRLGVVAMARVGGLPGMVAIYELTHRWFPRSVDCRPIYLRQCLLSAGFRIIKAQQTSLFGLPVEVVVSVNS
jgi:ubiquinone/menaquinone biosynthesis C-methylase UbiE